jgi:hypothetical protein
LGSGGSWRGFGVLEGVWPGGLAGHFLARGQKMQDLAEGQIPRVPGAGGPQCSFADGIVGTNFINIFYVLGNDVLPVLAKNRL